MKWREMKRFMLAILVNRYDSVSVDASDRVYEEAHDIQWLSSGEMAVS